MTVTKIEMMTAIKRQKKIKNMIDMMIRTAETEEMIEITTMTINILKTHHVK